MSSRHDYYGFERLALGEVKQLVSQPKTLVDRNGYRLQVHHTRLRTFTLYGCFCWACRRKADRFVAETHINQENLLKWYFNPLDNPPPIAHVNLYGTDPRNKQPFMMTSDHVKPLSLGGSNSIKNRIPLCETCNAKKGNDPDWLKDLPRDRNGTLMHRANRQVKGKKAKRKERYYA